MTSGLATWQVWTEHRRIWDYRIVRACRLRPAGKTPNADRADNQKPFHRIPLRPVRVAPSKVQAPLASRDFHLAPGFRSVYHKPPTFDPQKCRSFFGSRLLAPES